MLPFYKTSQYVDMFEKYDAAAKCEGYIHDLYEAVRNIGLDHSKIEGRTTWMNGPPSHAHLLLLYACHTGVEPIFADPRPNTYGLIRTTSADALDYPLVKPPMVATIYSRPAYIDPIVRCGGLDSINFATRLRFPVRSDSWDLRSSAHRHTWGCSSTNQTALSKWFHVYGMS